MAVYETLPSFEHIAQTTSYADACASFGVVDMSYAHGQELWKPMYAEYERERQLAKVEAIAKFAKPHHDDIDQFNTDAQNTYKFIEECFDYYEGKKQVDHPGSFGFVVPTRIDREHWDYSAESEEHFPLLKYVDVKTRQLMLVGMPPFIIDRYGVTPDNRRGYMIFAPLFTDMITDLGERAFPALDKAINDTAEFAKERLGISVIGLGAILPRLTDMGKMIHVDGLDTTTGHGGTVWLINETMRAAEEQGLVKGGLGRVGIIGSGAIGSSTADLLLADDPTRRLTISDRDEGRLVTVVKHLTSKYPAAKVIGTTDNTRVINENDAIVSAVTTMFDLDDHDSPKNRGFAMADFEDKFILDDSQPGAFPPQQLEARGAILAWPIGRDNELGYVTRDRFDYKGTGPASKDDIWGCEAEAAAIGLTGERNGAIKTVVTPEQAKIIGDLCAQINLRVAPLQRMGRYI